MLCCLGLYCSRWWWWARKSCSEARTVCLLLKKWPVCANSSLWFQLLTGTYWQDYFDYCAENIQAPTSPQVTPLSKPSYLTFLRCYSRVRYVFFLSPCCKKPGAYVCHTLERAPSHLLLRPGVLRPRCWEDGKRWVLGCWGILQSPSDTSGLHDIAVVRIEQLSPFPFHQVKEQVEKWVLPPVLFSKSTSVLSCTGQKWQFRYPNAEVVWCQEEPRNQGAWQYVSRAIETSSGSRPVGPLSK
mgnify:CR=1 FL=1